MYLIYKDQYLILILSCLYLTLQANLMDFKFLYYLCQKFCASKFLKNIIIWIQICSGLYVSDHLSLCEIVTDKSHVGFCVVFRPLTLYEVLHIEVLRFHPKFI